MGSEEVPTILPIFPRTVQCTVLQSHIEEMQVLFKKYIRLPFQIKSLPILLLNDTQAMVPGALSIFILSKSRYGSETQGFISEMISRWLIPGQQLMILSSRNFQFRFLDSKTNENFFMTEMLLQVDKEQDLFQIRSNWPMLSQEIGLGLSSWDHACHILEVKGLSKEQKSILLHKSIVAFMKRHPKVIEPDIYDVIQQFLLLCDDEFKKIHNVRHMARIIALQYIFRKELRRAVKAYPKQRHVRFKFLKTRLTFPFGSTNVLGMVISLNLVQDEELFSQRHVLSSIRRFISNVEVVQHSFFSFQEKGDAIRSLYLEIEKEDHSNFSIAEIKILNAVLANELKGSIEVPMRSIFMPRNEEEIFRYIMNLSRELKFVRDVAQVIITFQDQKDRKLRFNVILVRILLNNSLSIRELFHRAKSSATFIFDQVKVVGQIRKKYDKEANVFSVILDKEPFLRKDYSVDLSKARQFVVSTIEEVVGDIRDFNGGLIVKQSQLLNSVKKLLNHHENEHEFLLENFFYSLTPVVMQSLLPPMQVKRLFSMFLNLLRQDGKKREVYLLKVENLQENISLVIRADDSSFVKEVSKAIESLKISSMDLASTFVTVHGYSYLAYNYNYRHVEYGMQFCQTIEKALENWKLTKQTAPTLRISLPTSARSLDPRIGSDRTLGNVIRMLYEGLMRIGKNGKPTLAAAEKVEISEDLKCYTFTIRDSVWSDGTKFTASDFEYAWKKVLDPNFKTLYSYMFYPIKNAKKVKENKIPIAELGVYAKDDKTLIVELENPAPYFLDLTAHWLYSPLRHDIDKNYPGWSSYGGDTYLCNGPFKLENWKHNQEIQLVKNPQYWDSSTVQLQNIHISIVEDSKMALSLYEQGELDWIGAPLSEIPFYSLINLQTEQRLANQPVAGVYWLEFNIERMPLNSVKMRRALSYAIDREALINMRVADEKPAMSIIPPTMSLHNRPYFNDGDVQTAKKLFDEALAELRIDNENIPPLILSYNGAQEGEKNTAQMLAQQWKLAFGIEVSLDEIIPGTYFQRIAKRDFQMCCATWYSWFNDPLYNLQNFKYKDDSLNTTHWENPEYIKFLELAESSVVLTKRREYLQKAEEILMNELPVCPIYHSCFKYMKKPFVNDVLISSLGHADFKWTTVY